MNALIRIGLDEQKRQLERSWICYFICAKGKIIVLADDFVLLWRFRNGIMKSASCHSFDMKTLRWSSAASCPNVWAEASVSGAGSRVRKKTAVLFDRSLRLWQSRTSRIEVMICRVIRPCRGKDGLERVNFARSRMTADLRCYRWTKPDSTEIEWESTKLRRNHEQNNDHEDTLTLNMICRMVVIEHEHRELERQLMKSKIYWRKQGNNQQKCKQRRSIHCCNDVLAIDVFLVSGMISCLSELLLFGFSQNWPLPEKPTLKFSRMIAGVL